MTAARRSFGSVCRAGATQIVGVCRLSMGECRACTAAGGEGWVVDTAGDARKFASRQRMRRAVTFLVFVFCFRAPHKKTTRVLSRHALHSQRCATQLYDKSLALTACGRHQLPRRMQNASALTPCFPLPLPTHSQAPSSPPLSTSLCGVASGRCWRRSPSFSKLYFPTPRRATTAPRATAAAWGVAAAALAAVVAVVAAAVGRGWGAWPPCAPRARSPWSGAGAVAAGAAESSVLRVPCFFEFVCWC